MRSLIVYYSYSGNTRRVAEILKEFLSEKAKVDIVELKPQDEANTFFRQVIRALGAKRALLEPTPSLNVADYDLVCIGTPVWAFAPAPAVNTYIDGLKNIEGKDAICFITYGSGLGAETCLLSLQKALRQKGVFKIAGFKIQQSKVDNKDFVIDVIKKYSQEVLR